MTELDNTFGFPQTTVVPEMACPACGARLDRASSPEKTVSPKAGDLCICIRCASVNRFDRQLRLRQVSDEFLRRMCAKDRELGRQIRHYQRLVLQVHEREGLTGGNHGPAQTS